MTTTHQTDMTDVLGLAQLDHDLDPVPVTDLPQAQGDLMILPWPEDTSPVARARALSSAAPVTSPLIVIEGRGGNAHVLVDPDRCGVSWGAMSGQSLGVLIVPEGGRACLDHAEHGRAAIGPGVWLVRRQREMAEVERMVAD